MRKRKSLKTKDRKLEIKRPKVRDQKVNLSLLSSTLKIRDS